MGDDLKTHLNDTQSMRMELWDTVNNEITEVEQPPGLENDVLFRPMILTFGEDSILFTGGSINNSVDYDGDIFQYTCGKGWKSKGKLNPRLESRQMYGIYTIKEKSQKQKDILNVCKKDRPTNRQPK